MMREATPRASGAFLTPKRDEGVHLEEDDHNQDGCDGGDCNSEQRTGAQDRFPGIHDVQEAKPSLRYVI